MTEHNLFCYSRNYNDKNSFQQKRYRAFNKEVGKERYWEILGVVEKILDGLNLELNENDWTDEWKKVTPTQWEKLLAIPEAKDFRKGFEYITGIKLPIEKKVGRPKLSVKTRIERLEKELLDLKKGLK